MQGFKYDLWRDLRGAGSPVGTLRRSREGGLSEVYFINNVTITRMKHLGNYH